MLAEQALSQLSCLHGSLTSDALGLCLTQSLVNNLNWAKNLFGVPESIDSLLSAISKDPETLRLKCVALARSTPLRPQRRT